MGRGARAAHQTDSEPEPARRRALAGSRAWPGRRPPVPVLGAAILGSAVAMVVPAAATPALGRATAAITTAAPPACGPTWTSVPAAPDASGTRSELLGVTRTPGGTVWAVGDTHGGGIAIIERLTRTGWVRAAAHVTGNTTLGGVAAVSDHDVWAVGTRGGPFQQLSMPLIDHWNGSRWTVVASPAVPQGSLDAVAALGPDDVWAVGTQDFERHTLTEHFNGTSWSVVPSLSPGADTNVLTGVAGSSASAVWAVGENTGSSAIAEYWDGTDWRLVTTPGGEPLKAVTVISASDAWAVAGSGTGPPIALHWNGKAWSQATLPTREPTSTLNGVAAAGPLDVWASGGILPGQPSAADNWNGRAWRETLTPALRRGQINAVAALPGGGALAVGVVDDATFQTHALTWQVCPAQVTSRGFTPAAVTDSGFQAVTWRAATSNHAAVTLRDGTGLGLFSSGPLPAGAAYSFRFYAAGTYPVIAGSARQTVGAPVAARPATGQAGSYQLTWAARVAQFGFVYDVRIKAPGASQFTAFRTGVSSIDATFTPAAGPGTYQVEARLRKGGARSGWSPPVSITVTG